jgi:hypothetical protein
MGPHGTRSENFRKREGRGATDIVESISAIVLFKFGITVKDNQGLFTVDGGDGIV